MLRQILLSNMKTQINKKQKPMKKIKTTDLGFRLGKNYFDNSGFQNNLMLQTINNTYKIPTDYTETILA